MNLSFFKKNKVYKIYFRIKHVRGRQTTSEFQNEVKFYSQLIDKKNLIFDVGANHGDKSAIFLKVAEKVIAFEPDHSNCEFLNHRFFKKSNFTLVPKAVSNETGKVTFFLVNDGSGLNTIDQEHKDNLKITSSYEVETTSLDEMIKRFGIPDFIKIDVEGHEISVLKGLTIPVKNISFEANLPEKLNATLACIKLLAKLNENYKFNYGYDYGLISPSWLDEKDIFSFIEKTNEPYLNIYCKLI